VQAAELGYRIGRGGATSKGKVEGGEKGEIGREGGEEKVGEEKGMTQMLNQPSFQVALPIMVTLTIAA
jgi:hypothetical protein